MTYLVLKWEIYISIRKHWVKKTLHLLSLKFHWTLKVIFFIKGAQGNFRNICKNHSTLRMKQAALFVDTSMQEAKWQRERTERPQLSGPRTADSMGKVTKACCKSTAASPGHLTLLKLLHKNIASRASWYFSSLLDDTGSYLLPCNVFFPSSLLCPHPNTEEVWK